ncbi:MAG TPA: AtpZ/AtpI family protein [Atribacterota bacterium]|nr:AtpZ/AtpI family protein [Atribacterota bacterium]
MDKKSEHSDIKKEEEFMNEIESKEKRKIRAQSKKNRAIWMGFGLFGVVGWSVMIPTIIGIIIGLWLDRKLTGRISWTLTFLILGIALGCWNAWYWVQKERKLIEKEREEE